ncbi:hypothetical protein [Patulibacter minatonensis]|uniref:hypothetical protein n=1 Tax=Patulibacter minatonensis TaxID=298163 RepID=UPI000478ADEE|nr:hypothetical protein [Patulibacter minatonensis]
MTATDPRDPSATASAPRLAALGVLVAGVAAAGLALTPGAALADGGPSWAAAGPASAASATLLRAGDDDATGDDVVTEDPAVDDDPTADDGSGETIGDDGGPDDDGSADDDATEDDDPIEAVVIDRRGRALEGPRSFAASKTVRAGRLHWSGWSDGTAVGKGRITVKQRHRRGSRAAATVRGTGTVSLSRLTVCSDGTPVYRKAVFVVAKKTVATVVLPGCSALD